MNLRIQPSEKSSDDAPKPGMNATDGGARQQAFKTVRTARAATASKAFPLGPIRSISDADSNGKRHSLLRSGVIGNDGLGHTGIGYDHRIVLQVRIVVERQPIRTTYPS